MTMYYIYTRALSEDGKELYLAKSGKRAWWVEDFNKTNVWSNYDSALEFAEFWFSEFESYEIGTVEYKGVIV